MAETMDLLIIILLIIAEYIEEVIVDMLDLLVRRELLSLMALKSLLY